MCIRDRNAKIPQPRRLGDFLNHYGGQSRDRTGDLSLFRRTLYRLSYLAANSSMTDESDATLTGLEPATSAVTGRRANQLRHRATHIIRYVSSAFCARTDTLHRPIDHLQIRWW